MLKAIFAVDDAKSNAVEKKLVLFLLILSILVSLGVVVFVKFQVAPFTAMQHWLFYRSVFDGILLLCMIPYVIAYCLGRLLTGISWLLKDTKDYATQYSLMFVLFFFFSYFFILSANRQQQGIDKIYQQCLKTSKETSNCAEMSMSTYVALVGCAGKGKAKQACIHKILTDSPFLDIQTVEVSLPSRNGLPLE